MSTVKTFLRQTKEGLKSRKITPKSVIHHSNEKNPARCLVRLFQKYNDLCPADRPDHALYLKPLKKPKSTCWYSRVPLGHNALADTIPRLMREAGIEGYFTNHSLRATATTRLYDAQVDEASIMERTGHRSVNGVRAYKRGSETLQEITSSVLNGSEKKAKVEAHIEKPSGSLVPSEYSPPLSVERSESESAQPPKSVSRMPMEALPTMPWNFGGASGFTINFNFGGQLQ